MKQDSMIGRRRLSPERSGLRVLNRRQQLEVKLFVVVFLHTEPWLLTPLGIQHLVQKSQNIVLRTLSPSS